MITAIALLLIVICLGDPGAAELILYGLFYLCLFAAIAALILVPIFYGIVIFLL